MKHFARSVVRLCVCVLGTTNFVGCDGSGMEPGEVAELEWAVPPDKTEEIADLVSADDNPVVAVIDSDVPGRIEFLDESEIVDGGGVGLVAFGAEGARAIGFLEEDASPLEVFLALALPSSVPPSVLVEDHARMAAAGIVPVTPRILSLSRAQTEGTICTAGEPQDNVDWWDSWSWNHGSNGGYAMNYFASGTAFVTGTSNQRALMACEDLYTAFADYILQSWNGATWSTVYTAQNPGTIEWGFAYKSSGSSGRYRLVLSSTTSPVHLFAAAKW